MNCAIIHSLVSSALIHFLKQATKPAFIPLYSDTLAVFCCKIGKVKDGHSNVFIKIILTLPRHLLMVPCQEGIPRGSSSSWKMWIISVQKQECFQNPKAFQTSFGQPPFGEGDPGNGPFPSNAVAEARIPASGSASSRALKTICGGHPKVYLWSTQVARRQRTM